MAEQMINAEALKVLTLPQFCELVGISIPTAKRLRKKGDLPRSIQLSEHRVGFRLIDIHEWQQKRLRG